MQTTLRICNVFMRISIKYFKTKIVFNKNPVENTGNNVCDCIPVDVSWTHGSEFNDWICSEVMCVVTLTHQLGKAIIAIIPRIRQYSTAALQFEIPMAPIMIKKQVSDVSFVIALFFFLFLFCFSLFYFVLFLFLFLFFCCQNWGSEKRRHS